MPFVTKIPSLYTTMCKLTSRLVSALLIIHKPFTPCGIFIYHGDIDCTVELVLRSSSLAKWLGESVRVRVRVRVMAREWARSYFFFFPLFSFLVLDAWF